MSFGFRQELTKTRRFSEEKWPKKSQNWLKRSLISRTWLEPKCAHPKNSPKWPFSRQKKRNKHFTVWTYRNIFFVSFLSGSPFFVLKIFTRPSAVLCLSLTTVLACHYLDYLYFFHHWTPWNCIRRTNSLPKKSFSNLPGKDGRAFSLVPGMHAIKTFCFFFHCTFSFNVKTSEFDSNLSTRCTTEFVATLGFDPPIAFGRIDPVS